MEDLVNFTLAYDGTLAFDNVYAYNILTTSNGISTSLYPFDNYDVSFYKNTNVSLPAYVPKTFLTPTTWNGKDYQQYQSVNYEGAFWVTNGVSVPFVTTNIGMQYMSIIHI